MHIINSKCWRYISLFILPIILISSCNKGKQWVELPEIPLVESAYTAVILDSAIVYHAAPYNAFSDLTFYEGNFYLTFRAAGNHGFDSTASIVVLKSKDFIRWNAFDKIKAAGRDVRDPKLFLYQGACYLNFSKLRADISGNRHQLEIYKLDDSRKLFDVFKEYESSNYWYWYIGELGGGLTISGYNKNGIGFFKSNANRISSLCQLEIPNEPSEARFVRVKNQLFTLVRTQRKGVLAVSDLSNICSPKLWQLPVFQFGGPNITVFDDENLLLSGRELIDNNNYGSFVKTALYMYNIKNNTVSKLLELPSYSDNGYAGHVVKNDTIFVSYYDHHLSTGKAVIKTVRIKIVKKDV